MQINEKPFENLFFPNQARSKIPFCLDSKSYRGTLFCSNNIFEHLLDQLEKIYILKKLQNNEKPFENLNFFRSKLGQKFFLTWIPVI